jgi:hypothetical protein
MTRRQYPYAGPPHLRATTPPAAPVTSARDLAGGEPILTFVVTPDGVLRVAPRRSEHVACAGGQDVLTAGELFVSPTTGAVTGATNLSTGYCPEPASWSALAAALDGAAIPHPATWTHAFDFRRCEACGERNLIKDDDYVCAVCDAELPRAWNFAT